MINFFKSTLTIPKIKDLVNSPAQKYENIYKTINSATTATIIDATDTTNATNITDITDIISSRESSLKNSSNVMKNELKKCKFLKLLNSYPFRAWIWVQRNSLYSIQILGNTISWSISTASKS